MTKAPSYLRLNRVRVVRRAHAVYDYSFHSGVNIIRGQNGSGKSTIADFIFFILGGEFEDWKDAASKCDEVQAEVQTPRGQLTLKRQITSAQEPMLVYFGSMSDASKSSLEGWERFPIRRQGDRESFSQMMFRSLLVPEAPSEGESNITMHQLLRLCYSDQRTPATRLFRFELFDTQNIREAAEDLLCGISGYEVYEIGLELRSLNAELEEVQVRLRALHNALPSDQTFNTPELIQSAVDNLERKRSKLQHEVDNVDELVNPGEVKEYLVERRTAQGALVKQREKLRRLELTEQSLAFELREIQEFLSFLSELMEKLSFAEATFDAIGSIEFTHCPACGEELSLDATGGQCVVCKSPLDPNRESARYNQIRLDLEIQTRESRQLIQQKESEGSTVRQELRQTRREHAKDLAAFDLKYSGANGPREAFLAERINRIGHIGAEIEFLIRSLDVATEIAKLTSTKTELIESIENLKARSEFLRAEAQRRRQMALTRVSDYGSAILRADLPRHPEFVRANNVSNRLCT